MSKDRLLSLILLITITFTFTPKLDSQTHTAIPICTNESNQSIPVISNGKIAWRDARNGTWDIYMYDLFLDSDSDGVPNWLDPDRSKPDPAEFLLCQMPDTFEWKIDISNRFIVFRTESRDSEYVGGYDLMLNKKFVISTGIRVAPVISNNFVAWMDWRNGNWGIWGYSLHHDSDEDGTPDIYDLDRPDPNRAGVQLSVVRYPSTFEFPDVSENVVVWEFQRKLMGQINICGYDLKVDSDEDGVPNWLDCDRTWPDTLASFNLTPGRSSWRGGIAACGTFIVWEEGLDKYWDWGGAGKDSSDLHGYDLSVDSDSDGIPNYLDPDRPDPDPAEFIVSSAPGRQRSPSISNNWIVWTDYRNGNADIYGYDLSEDTDGDGTPNYLELNRPDPDPAEKPIITDFSNQWTVRGSAISGSVLTWIDDRDGNKNVYACILNPDTSKIIASIIHNIDRPNKFALFQNFPNPFNLGTNIKYQIASDNYVTIKIYNMLGQEIKTLISDQRKSGSYTIHWDGKDNWGFNVPSGIYMYKIEAGNFIQSKKMLICK